VKKRERGRMKRERCKKRERGRMKREM